MHIDVYHAYFCAYFYVKCI